MDYTYSEMVPRANRSVLAEIETKGFFLSPTDPRQDVNRYNVVNNEMNLRNVIFGSEHDQSVSLDELAIRQRGRREIPFVFSPDIDVIKQSKEELSKELDNSNIDKSITNLKNIPRKRLLCDDPLESSSSQNDNSSSTDPKQKCIEKTIKLPDSNCLVSAFKALTKAQLISLIEQITIDYPDIEKEIRFNFPVADLKPLENQISNLQHNIYKNLPKSRLISKTDEVSYHRVSCHVLEFKKCVIHEGRLLVDSKHWPTVMEYVFMAWRYVYKTPIWDAPIHNAARIQCFKLLSSMCCTALEKMMDTLSDDQCKIYKNRLLTLKCLFTNEDDKDILACLQLLDKQT